MVDYTGLVNPVDGVFYPNVSVDIPFEIQQEIERLERKKKYNEDLTQIEKNTIDNQIKLQKQLLEETSDTVSSMEEFYKTLGNTITQTSESGKASLKDFGNAAIDTAEKAIAAWIAEAVAKMTSDAIGKTGFPAGLIVGPIAGAAALSIMKAIIPNFTQGGVVPGSKYYGDKVPAMVNSGELILNQRQSANLLYEISKRRSFSFDNTKMDTLIYLMQQNNFLIKNSKTAVTLGNKLVTIDSYGNLTGDKLQL